MNFSAVILAVGKSSRMGRDKAWLEAGGQPLLARQIQCAREAGAREVFVSGRAGVDYSAFHCPVLEDEFQNAGPLGGIARALSAVREPLLLVLAVDMANMNGAFLKKLHGHCSDGVGAVPVCTETIEPLAAFYPKAAEAWLQKLVTEAKPPNSPGAKHFAEACAQARLIRFIEVSRGEVGLFKSWNSPADVVL